MDMRLWDRNRLLTALAGSALLLVVVYWAWAFAAPQDTAAGARVQLAAPRPHPVDPALTAPLVSLMSPGAVQPQVQVLGVLAGDHTPLALLSVNGALPQAVAVGERLGPATVVSAISAEAVTLEQAGQANPLPVPALPPLPEQGIVRAR
ncbi:general secretion pathway protein [Stenotrophomonas sp. 278]|uniref:general secretion pathway protein n=1 Tax=Stenotrophomonas sp. 278 TaxID=2479851 RepID=UPI000F66042B|nr:general secretion pathway protein [Stenotrophomonas sp. 278]RRU12277.1 general secretion pathway protein [Stenotrophomonas sp. 278]